MHCQNILNIMDNNEYAGSSMARTKATMSAMFSDALDNGLIVSNPVTGSVKCPKKPEKNTRVLTLDEQDRFLEATKGSVNYFHFLFVLQTGVRSSELRGLRWEDIDFSNRTIHIRRNTTYNSSSGKFITGELKTNSGLRDIPMTQTAYEILVSIKNQQMQQKRKVLPFEYANNVFLNRNGNLLPNSNYDRYLEKLCDKAGIEKISMHTLRHTFATRCIESGMKPKTLQKILGHANIKMTQHYAKVLDQSIMRDMGKVEKSFLKECV